MRASPGRGVVRKPDHRAADDRPLVPGGCSAAPDVGGQEILAQATQPFLDKNPGIRLNAGFMQGNAIIPSMVAGAGPDIISDWNAAPYWEQNLLLRLDAYIRKDNVQTTVWSKGQMSVMQQPFGTFMLPAYFSPMVYVLRLSDFDEVGVQYPGTDWTYQDLTKLAKQLTIQSAKKTRYGTDVPLQNNSIGGDTFIFQAFGGNLMNADGTQQTLSSPGSIAAGRWMYEELFWPKIGSGRDQIWGTTGLDGFLQGQQSMRVIWGNGFLVTLAQNSGFKWRIYPFPIFPKGRLTDGTEDFYGINAQTKHPDEAWSLLKYLTSDPAFTRALMHAGLQTPAIISLWQEWQAVVEATAPPLKGKGLEWYSDAALKGYALPGQYFAHGDSRVRTIDNNWMTKLLAQQATVEGAYTQADQQANALIQVAASEAAAVQKTSATFPTQGPPIAGVQPGL